MSKTDGIILNRIISMPNEKLIRLCFFAAIAWIFSPIVAMISNLLGIDGYNFCGVWLTFLYVSGALGLIAGGLFLFKKYFSIDIERSKKIVLSEPLIFVGLFFLWCLFCTLFANEKIIAIYGYEKFHDNLFVYLFYGGMITAGIALKASEKYLLKTVKSFTTVATLLSVISIANNDMTDALCRNSLTETSGYEAVFFNTEHFAMYLVLAIILSCFLFLSSSMVLEKTINILEFEIMISALAFTGSLSGVIALAVGFIFVLFFEIKMHAKTLKLFAFELAAGLVTFCIILILLELKMTLPDDLLSLWHNTLKRICMVPVVGVGLQNFMGASNNVFLKIALYVGLPGLLLYLSSFVALVRNFVAEKVTLTLQTLFLIVAMISYFVFALFGTTMFYTAPYFYLIVGIVFGSSLESLYDGKNKKSEK